MKQIKKVFAGGNTSQGFYSFYHEIIAEDANHVFILKGGPGTGKSTFMRKVVRDLVEKGFSIEEFHCSSDANSLDGIVAPALKVGIIDGTAPHVVDPKFPGCVEEIINLGQYWDEDKIKRQRDEVLRLTKSNSACYPRAYRYLRAAKCLYDDMREITRSATNLGEVNQIVGTLIEEVFHGRKPLLKMGWVRHLFASAITPQGPVNELPSIVDGYRNQYILKGEPGTGKSWVLNKVLQHGLERGLYMEAYHCPIDPEKLDHLIIPELETAVITSYPPHIYESEEGVVINLNECVDRKERDQDNLHCDHVLFESLLDQVFKQLRKAKAIHDLLEESYVPNMKFDQIEQVRKRVVTRILAYNHH